MKVFRCWALVIGVSVTVFFQTLFPGYLSLPWAVICFSYVKKMMCYLLIHAMQGVQLNLRKTSLIDELIVIMPLSRYALSFL